MSDASAESYFHDPAREAFSAATRLEVEASQKRVQPTDAYGYVLRQSVNDESTRPDYVMAVGRSDGVWTMIRRIREFKPEGWPALWKCLSFIQRRASPNTHPAPRSYSAQLISTVLETLTPLVQASMQSFLLSIFTPESAYPLPPSRLPPSRLVLSLASHVLTGVLLSPLDLVRTRLIVQSSHPSHKTYAGPIYALRSAIQQEGGIRALYTHPSYFIPALLDNALRPLLTLSTPILLHRWLGIEEDTHPMSYALASCACACAALVVTLPVETIRRRMQVQSHGAGGTRGIQACIELSPRPYAGVLDTAWRIIKEERAIPRRRIRRSSRSRRGSAASNAGRDSFKGKEREDATINENEEEELEDDGWFASTGIAQLYRGFSMGLTANAVVFALGAFSGFGDDGSGSGWTEL
jgi:fusion and transport protein UGO1